MVEDTTTNPSAQEPGRIGHPHHSPAREEGVLVLTKGRHPDPVRLSDQLRVMGSVSGQGWSEVWAITSSVRLRGGIGFCVG